MESKRSNPTYLCRDPRALRRHSPLKCAGLSLVLFWLTATVAAFPQPPTKWLSKKAVARRLEESALIGWQDVPIRDALGRLSRQYRVAVFLDRRVDPNRKLQLNANASLRSVFEGIAVVFNATHAKEGAIPRTAPPIGVTRLGSVIYFGPREPARYLRTIAEVRMEAARKLNPAQFRLLSRPARLRWDALATPKQILQKLAKDSRVEILGIEEHIPHDLWPAADLPILSFVDRLTLLAVQFDLTFRILPGGKQVRLAPVTKADMTIERSHSGGRDPKQTAAKWRKVLPQAEIEVAGRTIIVRGRLEDHEQIARGGKKSPGGNSPIGTKTYTLTVKNKPVRELVRSLASQLKLKLKIDEQAIRAANIDLEKRVSFNVVRASVDNLFKAALSPAGLKHRLQDGVIEIFPAK